MTNSEAELILKINESIPEEMQQAYDKLVEKRDNETLTEDEHKKLLKLTEKIELLNVKRIEYLSKLSIIRQTSLTNLMETLGIKSAGYV